MAALVILLLSPVVFADECSDFCNLRLDISSCSRGSYCKNNFDCHGLFWTDESRSQICVLGITPDCRSDFVVECEHARSSIESISSVIRPVVTSSLPTVATTTLARTEAPHVSDSGGCAGRRWGMFTWDTSYYRRSNSQLLDFLASPAGREYACGDIYINVADYSSPGRIPDPQKLIDFIKAYRTVRGFDSIVYMTYGDVTARNGAAMMTFTNTFFDWVESISHRDAVLMGQIGVSYDVERLDAEVSKAALLLGRERRRRTAFGESNVKIQHTLDGDVNVLSTEYVMRYADSALAMLYSNTADGLVQSVRWLVTTQCRHCLDDRYSQENYIAKITIMVEASCRMGRGCSDKSMCIFDGPTEGAFHMALAFDETEGILSSGELLSQENFMRLFDRRSMWAVHNFEWFRCYAPFNSSLYPSCSEYHSEAASCRAQ